MGAAEIEAMMARLIEARDPWQELALWLGEQRARNTAMGGDDLRFIHLIAFQTAMVTLPLTSEARRIDRDVVHSACHRAEAALPFNERLRIRNQILDAPQGAMARPGGSDEPVKVRALHPSDPNADVTAIGLEELTTASTAGQCVMGDGLKDRFDLLLIAGCTYEMRGITVGFALVKFVHKRALFGAGERVATRLGLKAVDATLFLIQFQKRALHRYLLRLKPDQPIEQVRDHLLRRSGIDIRLLDQCFDVLCSIRRTLGEAYDADAGGKDGRDVL